MISAPEYSSIELLSVNTDSNLKDLHPWERVRFRTFKSSHRGISFIAGRIAAKATLTKFFGVNSSQVAILSWNRFGLGCPPSVWVAGRRMPGCLSISHDDHHAVAVWSESPRIQLGIDLAPIATQLGSTSWFLSGTDSSELGRYGLSAVVGFVAKEAAFKASRGRQFRPHEYQLSVCDSNHLIVQIDGEQIDVELTFTAGQSPSIIALATTNKERSRKHQHQRKL
jgi:4'-phosphopantetheinyl transferase EntD